MLLLGPPRRSGRAWRGGSEGRQRSEGRARREAWLVAVVAVELGAASTLTGWHREAAVPLLMLGIVYAVAVLLMDGRRRY